MGKEKNKKQSKEPEQLKTIIEPGGKNGQYWKDIWRYRSLALTLCKRDITVRYKQTIIGFGWSIISPVVNMLIMSFVFGSVAKLSSDGDAPYQVMVYAGIIPWTLFTKNFNITSNAFLSGSTLLKKVYFPRIIAPIGSSVTALVDAAISYLMMLLIIGICMLTSDYMPTWRIFLAPLFCLLPVLLGFFSGLIFSPGNIRYRDLNQILPFALQIGQYITPVAYSFTVAVNAIPEQFRLIYSLNPCAGVVNAVRWCIIPSNEFHWPSFISALCFIAICIPLGIHMFRKGERTFVDLV